MNSSPTVLDAYVRVSQVGGRSGDSFRSPTDQRSEIQSWADRNAVTIAQWHEDLDESGGTIERPKFQEVLARIERGETGGIVTAYLSRFARTVPGQWRAIDRIRAAHGSFVAVAESLEVWADRPLSADTTLTLNMLGSIAQHERDRAVEQWDRTTASAIERGIHFTNSVPLGYLRGADRRLAPDPGTAAIVREMFERRARRQSLPQIASWLNEVTPREDGRDWTARRVAAMVKSRAYLGIAFHGEHENADAHPALVTLPEWTAANAVTGGPGGVGRESALLAGLVRCAGCRYAMRRQRVPWKLADGTRRYADAYVCQKRHTGGVCPAPAFVMASVLEPVVIDHFFAWHSHDATLIQSQDNALIGDAERQLVGARARLDRFLGDDELRETITREAFLAEADRRQAAVTAAAAALERLKTHAYVDSARLTFEEDDWTARTTEERRQRLAQTIDTIYVRRGRSVPIEQRVLVRWAGEDKLAKPRRGTTDYTVEEVQWPDASWLPLANIPKWAWRTGHHRIPKGLLDAMRETDPTFSIAADGLHLNPEAHECIRPAWDALWPSEIPHAKTVGVDVVL